MFRTAQTGFRLTLIKQRELTENCLLQLIFLSVQRTGGLTCSTGFIVSVETGASPKFNYYNVIKKRPDMQVFFAKSGTFYKNQNKLQQSIYFIFLKKQSLKPFDLNFCITLPYSSFSSGPTII